MVTGSTCGLRRAVLAFGSTCCLLILAACGGAPAHPAITAGTSAATPFSAPATLTPERYPPTPDPGWVLLSQPSLCRASTASPTVQAPTSVYVGTAGGSVLALRVADGSVRWRYATGIAGVTSLVAEAEVVIAVVGIAPLPASPTVIALNSSDGSVPWKYGSRSAPNQSGTLGVAVSGGVVYVSGYSDMVDALDANTGARKWHFALGDALARTTAPAAGNGMVYFGVDNGSVYALDASTGALRWQHVLQSTAQSLDIPTVSGTGVYIGGPSFDQSPPPGATYALDGATGTLCWAAKTSTMGSAEWVTVSDGEVIAAAFTGDPGPPGPGPSGAVYALDVATGSHRWTSPTAGVPAVLPRDVSGGIAYIGGGRQVYAVDLSTGALRWSFPAQPQPNSAYSPSAIGNGAVYVGGPDTNVYALSMANGAAHWRVAAGSQIDDVVVGP